jgi:hypothetical protein
MARFKGINQLNEDECIVLFRKGSRGEVVAIYNNAADIAENEIHFNPRFSQSNIYFNLQGYTKSFKLLHLKSVVVARIRKRADIIKEDLNNEPETIKNV